MKIYLIPIIVAFVIGAALTALASKGGRPSFMDTVPLKGSESASTDDQPIAAEETATAEQAVVDEDANEPETEELDRNAVWQPTDSATPMAKGIKDRLSRCVLESSQDKALIQELCPGKLQPAEVCAVGDAESGGTMCRGATQGEPCKDSPKGAKGRYQVMPRTATAWWPKTHGVGQYDPQNLEHSKRVAIAYLCHLKETVGEANMFRAYNGGPAGFNRPKARENTIRYDLYVRNYIPIYQAALEGRVDFNTPDTTTATTRTSPPVPIGRCWISSVFGEPRTYRGKGKTHQGGDFACLGGDGDPVYAIADGIVDFAGAHTTTEAGKRAGVQVQLRHGNGSIGTLAGSWYFHLASVSVNIGQKVRAGDEIGRVGFTGIHFSGPHLHFQSFIWGANHKPLLCETPGVWFPTRPFASNFAGRGYMGPDTPGARAAAAKFNRMAEANRQKS